MFVLILLVLQGFSLKLKSVRDHSIASVIETELTRNDLEGGFGVERMEGICTSELMIEKRRVLELIFIRAAIRNDVSVLTNLLVEGLIDVNSVVYLQEGRAGRYVTAYFSCLI